MQGRNCFPIWARSNAPQKCAPLWRGREAGSRTWTQAHKYKDSRGNKRGAPTTQLTSLQVSCWGIDLFPCYLLMSTSGCVCGQLKNTQSLKCQASPGSHISLNLSCTTLSNTFGGSLNPLSFHHARGSDIWLVTIPHVITWNSMVAVRGLSLLCEWDHLSPARGCSGTATLGASGNSRFPACELIWVICSFVRYFHLL